MKYLLGFLIGSGIAFYIVISALGCYNPHVENGWECLNQFNGILALFCVALAIAIYCLINLRERYK